MKDIIFSVHVGIFFRQVFPCKSFFPVNQSAGIFFSEITHIPLKSQMVIPLWLILQKHRA